MNAAEFLARLDPIGFAVTRFVAGALWQSTILFAGIAIVIWLVRRRRASLKHVLLAVALLTAPLLPLLTRAAAELGTPRSEVKLIPPYREIAPLEPAVLVEPMIAPGSAYMPPEPMTVHVSPVSVPAPSVTDYPWALAGIAYAAGLAALLAWIAIGHVRINSWKRRASAVADGRVIEAFRRAAAALGVRRRFRILESAAIGCPFSVGAFDPVVFFPFGFASSLGDDELNAVALHETAHIKRRDPLVLSLVVLARAALFFQPLAWLAARRVSLYAEQAADDAVLSGNLKPLSYARALTRIAESICGPAVSMEIAAGVVISRSAFITRIEAILSDRRDRIRRVSRLVLLAIVIAVGISVALTLAVPLGDKDVDKPSQAPAQVASASDSPKPAPKAEMPGVAGVELESAGPNALPPSVLSEPDETIPTTCAGRVVDAEGNGVAGARVVLYQTMLYGGDIEGFHVRGKGITGADGTFAVKAITNRSHYVYIIASKEGLAMSWREWASDSSGSITITLGKPFRLAGTIVDESGNSVPGAEVRAVADRFEAGQTFRIGVYGEDIDCLTRTTDASGRFVFEAMPEGSRATFRVAAPGKVTTWTETPEFNEPQTYRFAAGDENIRITLQDCVVVSGKVVEKGTGRPAAGVRLTVSGGDRNSETQRAVSAADGTFRADRIAPGMVRLSGSMQKDSGWLVEWTSVVVEEGTTGHIVIEATRGACLEVSAVDADTGKPVRRIRAYVSEAGTDRISPLFAGADGVVRFRLRPGSYVLKYVQGSGSGYSGTGELGLEYDLKEGETERAQVKLERRNRTVSGVVKDADGNPVAGVSVLLCPQEYWTTPTPVMTDENGRYETTLRADSLDKGDAPYVLVRDARHNAAAAAEITPKGQPTDVTLAPAASITGRITTADGTPARGATVSLSVRLNPSVRYSIMMAIESNLPAGADGRYEIKALPPSPAKSYVLKTTAPGFNVRYVKVNYDAPRAGAIEVPPITLNPADRFVSGVVVDANDKPISGVEVGTDRYTMIESGEGQPQVSAKTGPDGRFRLEGIAPGKVRISVGTGEMHNSVTVDADTTDAKLYLESGSERLARIQRPPEPLPSLIGKPLPDTDKIHMKPALTTIPGPLVVCFVDPDSRPSRELVNQLSERKVSITKEGIRVVLIDTSGASLEKATQWAAKNNVPYTVGVITKDHAQVLRAWGVPGVPRLILADKARIVRAEDVSLPAILAMALGDEPDPSSADKPAVAPPVAETRRAKVVFEVWSKDKPTGYLEVSVKTPNGEPYTGDLRAIVSGHPSTYLLEPLRYEDGMFGVELYTCSAGVYLMADGYKPVFAGPVEVVAGGKTAYLDVTLEKSSPARFAVSSSEGRRPAKATVKVFLSKDRKVIGRPGQPPVHVEGDDPLWEIDTDGQGHAVLADCPAFPVHVMVIADGFQPRALADVTLSPNRITEFELSPARPSAGRAVDASTGRPVEGARVTVYECSSYPKVPEGGQQSDATFRMTWGARPIAVSDSQGKIALTSLLGDPWIYWFEILADGYRPTVAGPLRAGDDLGDVQLKPPLEVSVMITAPQDVLRNAKVQWMRVDVVEYGQIQTATGGAWRDVTPEITNGRIDFHLGPEANLIDRITWFKIRVDFGGPEKVFFQRQMTDSITGIEITPAGVIDHEAALVGRPLPDTDRIDIKPALNTIAGPLLVCFFDPDSRPSRELVNQLSEQKVSITRQGVTVVLIDASGGSLEKATQWGAKNNVPYTIGVIAKDYAQVLRAWRVSALPRLILADKVRIVRAEDVSLSAILAVPLGDEPGPSPADKAAVAARAAGIPAMAGVELESAGPNALPPSVPSEPDETVPTTCTGRVVDAEGKGVPGARVVIYQTTIYGGDIEGFYIRGKGISGADGTFAVKAITNRSNYAYIIAGKEGLAMSWREWATHRPGDITITLGRPFRLAGTIVDESGNSVPGAEVRAIADRFEAGQTFRIGAYGEDIDCLTRTTDASGRFVFEAMPEGSRVTFRVAAPGKVTTWTERPEFYPPRPYPFAAGDENIRITLQDCVVVSGKVVEKGTGKPVAGARLLVFGGSLSGESQLAVSAADGTFRADRVAPGMVRLSGSMQKDFGWLVERTSAVVEKGTTGDIVVEATRGALLEVSAVDADTGNPVRRIDASVKEASTNNLFVVMAGADGTVRFRLRPGSYVLSLVQATGGDYNGSSEMGIVYDLKEGETQRAQVKLERRSRTVSGVVKDAGGKPVAGVSVLLCPQEYWTTPAPVMTDENGRYETTLRTDSLDKGDAPYVLVRDARHNAAATAEIAPKGQSTDVTLAPAASIVGRITAADGTPAQGATVSLSTKLNPSVRYSIMMAIESNLPAGADGRYEIKALPPSPAKSYVLRATAPGWGVQYVTVRYDAPRTGPVEVPPITLNPANHFVSGIVVDANDKPVSGVEVGTDRYAVIESGEGQPYVSAKTGPDGRFRLEGITAGKARISVRAGENFASVTVNADTTDAKLVLESPRQRMARLERPPEPLPSLIGKPLPDTDKIDIKPALNTIASPLLVCFFDPDSRPSRELVKELSERKVSITKQGITVVLVDTSGASLEKATQWGAKNNVPYTIGVITKDHAQVLRAWGVPGVPRLILADKARIVRAEDVSLSAILAVPLGEKAGGEPANTPPTAAQSAALTCRGVVQDAGGNPVAGAQVVAYQPIDTSWDQEVALRVIGKAATGPDGSFTLAAPEAIQTTAYVTAAANGLSRGWCWWVITDHKDNVEIALTVPKRYAGTVVDAGGAPVKGAEVQALVTQPRKDGSVTLGGTGKSAIDWLTMVTDARGRFLMEAVPDGATAVFIASAPGHATASTMDAGKYDESAMIPAGNEDIRITLPAEGKISGRVTQRETGKPIAGVKLYVRPHPLGLLASAQDGNFTLRGVAEGKYEIRLASSASGEWVAEPAAVTVPAGKEVRDVRVEVLKGGVLEFAVTDADTGKPVDKAQAQVNPEGIGAGGFAVSGGDGIVRIRVLPGRYVVGRVGRFPDYADYRSSDLITIADGGTKRIEVRLTYPYKQVKGILLDDAGKPVAGADVAVLPNGWRDSRNTHEPVARSDKDGRFAVKWQGLGSPDAPDRWKYLFARQPDMGLAGVAIIEYEEGPFEVRMRPGSTLAGRVTGSDGKPLAGAGISLSLVVQTTADWICTAVSDGCATDADGRYALPAIPASPTQRYQVNAGVKGYSRKSTEVVVDEPEIVDVGTIVLRPGNRSISGVVVDSSGKPVVGAMVIADATATTGGELQPEGINVITGPDGRFTINGVTEGPVPLYAYDPHSSASARANVEAGDKDVKIILRK